MENAFRRATVYASGAIFHHKRTEHRYSFATVNCVVKKVPRRVIVYAPDAMFAPQLRRAQIHVCDRTRGISVVSRRGSEFPSFYPAQLFMASNPRSARGPGKCVFDKLS